MLTGKSALEKDRRTGIVPLQHRHYATIAAIIRAMPGALRRETACHFACKLQASNDRFDKRRFLTACGE